MNEINLLDCTLRDGGYTNDWMFGGRNITHVIEQLAAADVELIECGYLTAKFPGSPDCARYNDFDAFRKVLPATAAAFARDGRLALMINFGEFPLAQLPSATAESPVIRLAFHKRDLEAALAYLKGLRDLGYRVFVQPMSTQVYSAAEFSQLVARAGECGPDAFYIVDSFGVLEGNEFSRYLMIADALLPAGVKLGYHGHNNLQQAAANARFVAESPLAHPKVIDASVFGIGRGAGNLNIELFAKYLNERHGKRYGVEGFLEIYDQVLKAIYERSPWGYSLPYYLSAMHRCHPNYAAYFAAKGKLGVQDMHRLLRAVPLADRTAYTKDKAERLYAEFSVHGH